MLHNLSFSFFINSLQIMQMLDFKFKIENELNTLLEYNLNWENIKDNRFSNGIGILSGLTGAIPVLFDLYKKNHNLVDKEKIIFLIKKIFENIENDEILSPTYCDGLAGIGFIVLKLKSNNFFKAGEDDEIVEFIDDLLLQLDEILSDQLHNFLSYDEFDILHGSMGLGMYFLERDLKQNVSLIIEKLYDEAYFKEDEIHWKKYDKYQTHTTVIDMGQAHGNAAVLFFLMKASKKIENEKLSNLIKGSLNFYINNFNAPIKGKKCFYPSLIKADEYEANNLDFNVSRLAWCYGDLGVLNTLLLTIKELNLDFDLIANKLEVLFERRYENEFFVIDNGFCHGTSGIGAILDRMNEIINSDNCKIASEYWYQYLFNSKDNSNESYILGYDFSIADSEEQNLSLLEGVFGLIYSYSRLLYGEMPITEEALLIKF